MTTSNKMSDSDIMSDNKWQQITTSHTKNKNELKRIRAIKKKLCLVLNKIKYAMHNYNIFKNIDYL